MPGAMAKRFTFSSTGAGGSVGTEGMELVRSRSRFTKQAEAEVLWQLKDRNFSQVSRELGVGYGTLRCFLEREIDEAVRGRCKIPKKGKIKFPTSEENMFSYDRNSIIGGSKEDDNVGRVS